MTSQDDNKEFLKISEAARLLGVSQKTVYRWILSGELAASKMGGLHLIHREDLQSRLSVKPGAVSSSESIEPVKSILPERVSGTALPKCGACFQLILSESQGSGRCAQDGCSHPICVSCAQKGIRHCLSHSPTLDQIYREAGEKLERGEYKLLLKSASARQREQIYLHRLDARLSTIKSLVHPLTGELLAIPSWETLCENADEQATLLKLLNRMFLDAAALARYPLNASLRYRILPGKGQKSVPLELVITVHSRMERMVRQQYDTAPLGREYLNAALTHLTSELEREQYFCILVLASTTGWDDEARQLILGTRTGTAYFHRQALVYLYDFENGELAYNPRDERASGYAELFSPAQPEEELYEIQQAIESEFLLHDSLALQDALSIFPYKRGMVEAAFRRMAGSGRYRLIDLPQAGETIIRQN